MIGLIRLKIKRLSMNNSYQFLRQKGNYRDLIAYQKAVCIYDITYYFAHTYLEKGDQRQAEHCRRLIGLDDQQRN